MTFRILIADTEKGAIHIARLLWTKSLPPHCNLLIESAGWGEEVLEIAERRPPDLYMFFFANNLRFKKHTYSFVRSSPRKILLLMTHLKTISTTPIWVINGYEYDCWATEMLRKTADWYVTSPFDPREFEIEAAKLVEQMLRP